MRSPARRRSRDEGPGTPDPTTHWVCEGDNYLDNDTATLTVLPRADGSTVCTFQHVLPQVTREMFAGWNTLTFTGGSGTPTANLAAAIGTPVESIFRFDAMTGSWDSFFVDAPAVVNSLITVNQRDALFVRIASETPPFPFTTADFVPHGGDSRAVQIEEGFQMLAWTGPFTTMASSLFAGDLDATPVFRWDAATQGWISFFPGQPAALSGFLLVNRLDVLAITSPPGVSGQVQWPEAWPLE